MTELLSADNKNGKGSRKAAAGIALLLFAAVFALFSRTAGFDFVNIDDDDYIYNNQHIVKGLTIRGVVWAMTATHAANWHPLTWLSHMLDMQLFGLDPAGHHLMNAALHSVNALLLFLLLRQLTGTLWRSAAVATLFALHPLHVESVAWVAERKDLLSTLFAIVTISFYTCYVRGGRANCYFAACCCYLLGLMAKPMLVTLPLLLLLLDYWPLKRLKTANMGPLLREKLPFLAAMFCSAGITLYAQTRGGAISSLADTPLVDRAANALVSYQQYLLKTILPTGLAVFYPFPGQIRLLHALSALALLVLITWLAISHRQQRPWLLTGWLWYLISLLPVIGIVTVGSQAMADRYTYLSLTGIFIILIWLGHELLSRHACTRQIVALSVITLCSLLSWQQLGYWRNAITLNRRALAVTGNNYIAENNLGLALDRAEEYEEALLHFREAVRIAPLFAKPYVNMAEVLRKTGRVDEGFAMVNTALQIQPGFPLALDESAALLLQAGRPAEALTIYRAMLKTDADSADILQKIGIAASRQGDRTTAIDYFRRSLEMNPLNSDCLLLLSLELDAGGDRSEAERLFAAALRNTGRPALIHTGRAVHLRQHGELAAAEAELELALRLDPALASAHSELAIIMLLQKRPDEAMHRFQNALRFAPNQPETHYNLGLLFAARGERPAAIDHLRAASRLNPGEADYRFNLGMELQRHGLQDEAAAEFAEVLRLKPRSALAKLANEQIMRNR
jgi:tetratricopeptide (TPR) repeat protein